MRKSGKQAKNVVGASQEINCAELAGLRGGWAEAWAGFLHVRGG